VKEKEEGTYRMHTIASAFADSGCDAVAADSSSAAFGIAKCSKSRIDTMPARNVCVHVRVYVYVYVSVRVRVCVCVCVSKRVRTQKGKRNKHCYGIELHRRRSKATLHNALVRDNSHMTAAKQADAPITLRPSPPLVLEPVASVPVSVPVLVSALASELELLPLAASSPTTGRWRHPAARISRAHCARDVDGRANSRRRDGVMILAAVAVEAEAAETVPETAADEGEAPIPIEQTRSRSVTRPLISPALCYDIHSQ
jgi:hypothetical protein